MNAQYLVADAVIRRPSGQVAVHVAPPVDFDLQFIYRAGLCIYWDPDAALIEDRASGVETSSESAARLARALIEECGFLLRPSTNVQWSGFDDDEQRVVGRVLFGCDVQEKDGDGVRA